MVGVNEIQASIAIKLVQKLDELKLDVGIASNTLLWRTCPTCLRCLVPVPLALPSCPAFLSCMVLVTRRPASCRQA